MLQIYLHVFTIFLNSVSAHLPWTSVGGKNSETSGFKSYIIIKPLTFAKLIIILQS